MELRGPEGVGKCSKHCAVINSVSAGWLAATGFRELAKNAGYVYDEDNNDDKKSVLFYFIYMYSDLVAYLFQHSKTFKNKNIDLQG